jgi:hypothetical protein
MKSKRGRARDGDEKCDKSAGNWRARGGAQRRLKQFLIARVPTANKTFLIIVLLSGAPGATLAFFFRRLSPKIYFNYIKVNLAAQMTAGCAKRE